MRAVAAATMTLPILKVLAAALMLLWERRALLVRALWLPLLAGIGISLAELRWGPATPEQSGGALWALPIFALTIVVAVRTYRVLLIGNDPQVLQRPLSWSLRETRFLLAMFGVGTVFAGIAFLAGSLIGLLVPDPSRVGRVLLVVLVLIPGAYFAGRLLLAFPAIAAEDDSALTALQRAWNLSHSNGARILLLCIGVPGLLAWLLALLGTVPGAGAVSTILVWLTMPAELAIVAMVYATLSRHADAGAAPAQ